MDPPGSAGGIRLEYSPMSNNLFAASTVPSGKGNEQNPWYVCMWEKRVAAAAPVAVPSTIADNNNNIRTPYTLADRAVALVRALPAPRVFATSPPLD